MPHKLALTVRQQRLQIWGCTMSYEFDNLDANEKVAVESEPDVPISGIRPSDWLHRAAHNGTVSGRRSRLSRPSVGRAS
jgi:hypothetical protein